MNGSRSNTPQYGGKPSLDQLNRTIEGLEARIQGLMGERSSYRGPSANPVDEIIERQRSLGNTRERVSAVIERNRPESQHYETQRYETARFEQPPERSSEPAWDRPAPRVAAPDPAIAEIAATLSALRNELNQGLGDSLQGSLGELKSEIRGLKASAAASPQASMDELRGDLAILAQSLDKLESAGRNTDTRPLRADLDELRAMLGGVAREDSLRGLEARFADTEKAISGFSADAIREELVQLAWRIDGIKSGLGEMSAAPAVKALEEKLIAVANAVEMLGRNMQGQNAIAEQFSSLDQRLDEITRAIAATARQSGSVLDGAALQRLESRIEDLVDHIGTIQVASPADDLAGRIEALTARIEEMATEEAARKLEDRLAQLSNLIERNFRESAAPAEVADHLEDISRKIDGLGTGNADALIARLDLLSRKMDEMEMPSGSAMPAGADMVAMTRLETRLADIAARLDETAAAPASDQGALRNLERQIANLSNLLNQPGAAMPAAALPDGFGERMSAIEDYIASSDEFIVEAARQAAETVVEAYSRNGLGGQQGVSASEMQALSGLAEDLRALESHTRSSEERTQATFEALHETLVQIAGRLNDLGTPAPAERIAERPAPPAEPVRESRERLRETVAMPAASQPDFADLDLLADEPQPQPRRAPENSKVAVLDEDELMSAADDTADDLVKAEPVNEPARAETKASKSLIANLAARLKPAKKAKSATGRVSVDPAPALDPGEAVVAAEPNLLLEPGSGVPDVKKILEKVRNSQQTGKREAPVPGSSSDVSAAARRAAQAAAAEAGAQKFAQPTAFKKDKEKQASKSLFSGMGDNRRPILLAAAAVLLVVMSYPLVSNLIGNRAADTVAPETAQERTLELPAEITTAASDMPAIDPATPVEDKNPPVENAASIDPAPSEETASDKMMAPAETADEASTLEKPAEAAPAEVAGDQPADETVRAEQARAVPAVAAQTSAEESVEAPADSQTAVTPDIEVPAGLSPASLAEAVRKGDPLALFEIGARYTDGRGVKVDLAEAAKWYALAAEKGLAPAEYRLANFYEKGTGVTRDIARATALYLAAAEKGNASAMHNLAVLHATGVGGTPDFTQAAHWFTQAAELNVRDSQFNLAILYARGNGVQQDLTESYKWFAIAAREGDQDAAQKRDEVANALSAEQLKAAKAKLDLWKAKPLDQAANTPLVPDEWLAKGKTTATVDMKRAIRNIQAILNNNGFDAGKPDGEMGVKTIGAIKAFQKSVGQEPTGRIDDALVKELLKRNKAKS